MNRIKKQTFLAATAGTMMLALTVGCGGSGSTDEGKGTGKSEKIQGQAGTGGKAGTGSGGGAGRGPGGGLGRAYNVKTWESVSIRQHPDQRSKKLGGLRKNVSTTAKCWAPGRVVEAEGTKNHIWLRVGKGWASAIYFKGNEYGNLPKSAKC
ncbi:hypothetical protein ACIBI4_28865 [Streptomyces sp. NPDC050418]|uniref:hypothetical protein n=1 Tax=Streptomyces sp. NPDC050418 TaxID=3365612 RepID=UPI0037BC005E